jgi:hypothetical protein
MRKGCRLIISWMAALFSLAPNALADWSAAKRLTWNIGWTGPPAIAISPSGTIHIVWYDDTPGNFEVFYRRSQDSGATWGASKRLTWTLGGSSRPAMVTDSSDTIHVVWEDNTPGNAEIFYKRSTDGGATWSPAQRLTWNSGDSDGPAVATDSSRIIHVVWHDFTPGNQEIYYKKGT